MKSNVFILLLVLILFCPLASADSFYADVVIKVEATGDVTISGETNHPDMQIANSPEYTNKEGKYWLLNISFNDIFSDFVYELHLPEGASINYLKTTKLARIEEKEDGMSIIGTGSNQPFVIIVQYQLHDEQASHIFAFSIISLFFIILFLVLFVLRNKYKKKSEIPLRKYNLTYRQKRIVDLLEKNKKPLSQKKIQESLDLPKSSISRNINSLVQKGIVQKEEKGMTNIIFLIKGENK